MSIINNIIRSATRKSGDTLRCLTFCRENERYLRLLSKCNCELYVVPKAAQSDWKTNVSEIPKNVFVFRDENISFNSRPFFDCIISNDRLQEFDMAISLSNSLHIPIITIDHVSSRIIQKLPAASKVNVSTPLEKRVGNINVCLSEDIKMSWETSSHSISIVIPPCLDIESFDKEAPREGIVIDNNVPKDVMNVITSHLSDFAPTPRFPEISFDNTKNAKVYINTWNNIDIKTLEAMSLGCITVSPRTPEAEVVIEDKKNGLLFSDINELPEILKRCNAGDYDKIPSSANKVVKERSIDEESFIKKWNQVLAYISETFFLRN
jgi:hypothetical protein